MNSLPRRWGCGPSHSPPQRPKPKGFLGPCLLARPICGQGTGAGSAGRHPASPRRVLPAWAPTLLALRQPRLRLRALVSGRSAGSYTSPLRGGIEGRTWPGGPCGLRSRSRLARAVKHRAEQRRKEMVAEHWARAEVSHLPEFGRRLVPLLQARAKSAPKDASQSNDLGSSNRRRLTRGARRRRINSPRAGVGPGPPGKLCTRRPEFRCCLRLPLPPSVDSHLSSGAGFPRSGPSALSIYLGRCSPRP